MKVPASFKQKLSYYPNKRKPKITLSTVKLLFSFDQFIYESCVFFENHTEILERYESDLQAFVGHKKWEVYIDKLDDPDYIEALFEIEDSIGGLNG